MMHRRSPLLHQGAPASPALSSTSASQSGPLGASWNFSCKNSASVPSADEERGRDIHPCYTTQQPRENDMLVSGFFSSSSNAHRGAAAAVSTFMCRSDGRVQTVSTGNEAVVGMVDPGEETKTFAVGIPVKLLSSPYSGWIWNVLRGVWSAFGAVPILCCYVASLPVSNLGTSDEKIETTRDTLLFLVAAVCIGFARLAYLVYHAYTTPGKHEDTETTKANIQWRRTIFEGLHAYQVTVNLICNAALFLLFCQANPRIQSQRKRLNGTSFSSYEGYDEYAYVLALLAACRLGGSCFSVDEKAAGSFDYERNSAAVSVAQQPTSRRRVTTLLAYVDAGLSVASPIVFLVMCCTLPSDGDGFWRDTFVLSTSMLQRFFHWQMFLVLCFTYLLHDNFFISSRLVDCSLRLVVLAVGFTAFHFSLNAMQTPLLLKAAAAAGGNSARSQLVDFYAIRAWAHQGSETAVVVGRTLLQGWAALQTCRWFVAICHITLERLKEMRLDLAERHAADVDDVYFSMAAASILAAAYASHPLIPSATSPSHSAFFPTMDLEAGRHQAFTLQLVLSGVIYVFVGAWALHWVVSVVKGWWAKMWPQSSSSS